ncbi:MAG: PP2C family protein-serine/threonine phosphatase [Planctomycetota bacterium]
MAQDRPGAPSDRATAPDFENRVAAFGEQLDRGTVTEEELSAGLDAAVNSPPEVVRVAELLAAAGGGSAELRLRHLSELIDRGALDEDIYEAVVRGSVFFLHHDEAAARLLADFRLRYRCDIEAFDSGETLLEEVRGRRPDAVVIGASDPSAGANAILPELVVAAFGRAPVPVVLVSDDDECLTSFEVVTYPSLTFLRHSQGPEALLAALEQFLPVDRTMGTLRTEQEVKEQIGVTKAQAIQQNLLPEGIPEVPGLDIAAFYDSCQEVGGDYYDFLPLPDGRLGVVCADVSGKGVGAAMVMVMFRSILRLAAQDGAPARDVILRTNQLVTKDMLKGMFVSAAYVIVDPKTGQCELVNAGHMPVMHWPMDQTRPVDVPVGGMVVGLAADAQFEQATRRGELDLRPGELFCLYTDGIVEAENPARGQFGEERLAQTIRAAGRDAEPQAVVDRVVAAVADFCDGAPQHDDATLIVVKAL